LTFPIFWLFGIAGTIQAYDTEKLPPTLLWTCALNPYANNNVTMRLFGSVIVASSGGQIYRVDARNGTMLKLYELTSSLESQYTCMTIHKNLAISNSSHRMVAISRDKMKKVWKSSDLGDRFDCAEVVANRLAVAVDSEVYILDLESGQTVFSERFEGPRKAITLLADETTNPSQPLLYVGFCGKVHVIDLHAQKRLPTVLNIAEEDTFGVSLAMHRGLLVASSAGVVTAFQTSDLSEAWFHQFGHETGYLFMTSLHTIRHNGKDLVIVGSNGYALAVDLKSGAQLWCTSLPRGGYAFVSSMLYQQTLYVASNGKMWSLNLDDGSVLWSLPLSGLGNHSPSFLSTDGRNHMASDTPILQAQGRMPSFSLFR
jgi:outer membrane protein assembly factor BamB